MGQYQENYGAAEIKENDKTQKDFEFDVPPHYSPQQPRPSSTQPRPFHEQPPANGLFPLERLRNFPAHVLCPCCQSKCFTRVEHVSGRRTRRSAGILFAATVVLAPVPYLTNGTKDARHFCSNCGILLATWENSKTSLGQTYVVHQNLQLPEGQPPTRG